MAIDLVSNEKPILFEIFYHFGLGTIEFSWLFCWLYLQFWHSQEYNNQTTKNVSHFFRLHITIHEI